MKIRLFLLHDAVEIFSGDFFEEGADFWEVFCAVGGGFVGLPRGFVGVLLLNDVCAGGFAGLEEGIEVAPRFVGAHLGAEFGEEALEFGFVAGFYLNDFEAAEHEGDLLYRERIVEASRREVNGE